MASLAFAFDGRPQDLDRFRNEPFWRERFGDADGEHRFRWTVFYSAVAAKLLDYRADRKPLIEGIHAIAQEMAGLGYLQDRYPEGGTGPLRDICPFTAMGTFNRSMTDANRRAIAGALAKLIGVEEELPSSFEGIPVLNNQRSWFFRYGDKRSEGDIDKLWDLFASAAALVNSDQPEQRDQFISRLRRGHRRLGRLMEPLHRALLVASRGSTQPSIATRARSSPAGCRCGSRR